jgi:phage tail-like protein
MPEITSSYVQHLPPNLQESELLAGFLAAFERILSREADTDDHPALETQIAWSHRYVRPVAPAGRPELQAPDEFLPWLAGWVALTLRDDWDTDVKRAFIREVVGLYRYRGTKHGLAEMLRVYLGVPSDGPNPVTVFDSASDFGFEPPPHYFQVQIRVTAQERSQLRRIQRIAEAIIEQEKPAHTYYGLSFLVPTMQLNSEGSGRPPLILGRNSLLGTQEAGLS